MSVCLCRRPGAYCNSSLRCGVSVAPPHAFKTMNIVPAKTFDIPEIMNIERTSFIPQIQETQKTFEERLSAFPQGFLLLQDASDQTVLKNGKAVTAGYFCSEILQTLPAGDNFFELGHSALKNHHSDGIVLYVSSFALYPEYRGQKLAQPFFKDCLKNLCSAFPQIKTVLLLVNEEWTGARHIYRKLGFTEIRTIKAFFPSLHKDTADGIVMSAPAALFSEQAL